MKLKPHLPLIFLLFALTSLQIFAEFSARQTQTQQQSSPVGQPSPSPAPRTSPTPQTTPAPDEDVVRITTNLVQVDAVITDKNGKLVTDLRPEEVRIFEDGRQQTITNFSHIEAESAPLPTPANPAVIDKTAPPLPSVRLRPEQVKRTIALVVDDLGLSFESVYFVRRALKKFVDEQMQSGDLVAIIRTSGGIGALQQFTSDKRQLYAAIERVKWTIGRSGISPFAPIDSTAAQNEDVQAANEDFNQFREDVFAVGTLGAVGYVVRGLKELPGRKSILLLSEGFRIYSRDDPTRNYRALEALRRLIDQASRASVVIYTMNATGLQTLSLTAADNTGTMTPEQVEEQLSSRRTAAFESQDGLDYLAHETGGMAIRNTNDLSGGIKRILDDQKSYYLIGYRPDESTFDPRTGRRTFHRLSLKILRPGKYNVRMRTGFFGVSDEASTAGPRTARDQILGALFSPFGASGVHVRLTSLFANDAKLGSMTRSLLYIKGSDLTFEDQPDDWHQAVFDVLAVTFGDNGNVVDQIARTHTLRLRADAYKRVLRDGVVYYLTFPIKKSGAYQLRAAVRDHGNQRVGSASQFIEVPDIKKNRLVLSGVVLTGQRELHSKSSLPADGVTQASHSEEQDEADSINSSAVRQFHVGMFMRYGVGIYNARLSKDSGQPDLITQIRLFRDGKSVFVGKEQPLNVQANGTTDFKRLIAGGALQLGSEMVSGEYVFQIIVTDRLADPKRRVAVQSIDFEMVK